jgi:tripartite ATP-independent transporter DctM subunit
VATGFYLLASVWVTHRHPDWGPPGERSSWAERFAALKQIWGVLLLFALVMGGMYGGFFTPTEAAGVGAMGGFLFALARRALNVKATVQVLSESARTSAMLFTIVIGASLFANFLNFTDMPDALKTLVTSLDVPPLAVIFVICLVYVILGTAMESLSMMLLTVPIFFPLVTALGFDPVWFGIIVVCVIEISLITPPVGMNIFVLSSMMPSLPTSTVWRGVTPFIVADIARMTVLILFPALSLFLPRWLGL